jgi:hypothetical protein
MSEILSPAEVRDLAGCVAREAQCAKLETLGVPFRRDGARVLVSREHVRQWLSGVEVRQSVGVNLGAVR